MPSDRDIQKDRLIELIKQGENNTPCTKNEVIDCTSIKCTNCVRESIADYLLANGVIVRFFKVGGKVYFHQFDNDCKKVVVEGKIIKTSKNSSECTVVLKDERKLLFSTDFLGETVFLTKEEAEQALKERGKL